MKTQETAGNLQYLVTNYNYNHAVTVPDAAHEGHHTSRAMNRAIWNSDWMVAYYTYAPADLDGPEAENAPQSEYLRWTRKVTPKGLARILNGAWCVRQITFFANLKAPPTFSLAPVWCDGLLIEKGGNGFYVAAPFHKVYQDLKRCVKAFRAMFIGNLEYERCRFVPTLARELVNKLITQEKIKTAFFVTLTQGFDEMREDGVGFANLKDDVEDFLYGPCEEEGDIREGLAGNVMPEHLCNFVDLPQGSTYADGCKALARADNRVTA